MFRPKEACIGDYIGSGAFGRVHKYGTKYALKVIPYTTKQDLIKKINELPFGYNHDHPCIVRNYGHSIQENKIYIKMARMKMSLADQITQHATESRLPNFFSKEKVVKDFYCLVSAMSYLHSKGIAHKDIKPANIFINGKNDLLAVGDFGLSSQGADEDDSSYTNFGGTFGYIAPELYPQGFRSKVDRMKKKKDFIKGDAWSVGVTILNICLLTKNGLDSDNLDPSVESNLEKVRTRYGSELAEIIRSLLTIDPSKRASCEDARLKLKNVFPDLLATTLQVLDENRHHWQKPVSVDTPKLKNEFLQKQNDFLDKWSDLFKFSIEKDFSIRPRNAEEITDKDLEKFFGDFREFSQLDGFKKITGLNFDFAFCSQVTDLGLSYLDLKSDCVSEIQKLAANFSSCNQITEKGVRVLMTKLEDLEPIQSLSLDFSNCPKMTIKSLEDIITSIGSKLPDLKEFYLDFNRSKVLADEQDLGKIKTLCLKFKEKLQTLHKFELLIMRDLKISIQAQRNLQRYFNWNNWEIY